ncbi:uncharacterized protein CXQ87_003546 [Candidozyma duobushaemuli]|uniref:Cyclin-like domain-containing protein n=2 Tax=Candidozyma TaxID=3303203 RepID=A0ABX8I881_9ASCO|nr:uncharacterized protein CXQ87_003546 [[Candida] duobushaemulonis]PVH15700.1 hypothetical protein CXQ87_003546 [[Candida] duobushaemulonis]QWU88885.1 hypothetical protein CA3LBN_003193 [[Candida] haemuloni]
MKYGPPQAKPRQYPYTLEVLESQANKKLMAEYRADNKQWLASLEAQSAPNAQMIDLQPEVQWYMRPYLLDFLIELHQSFRLQPATLFLCINIIDRYCAKRIVFKRHYQLVGCTALWIAGKYEDKKSRVPTLRELAIMCRHAYDEEMFVQMEMHILATLEWSLSHPSLEECLQLAIAETGVTAHSTPCKYNRPSSATESSKVSAVTAVGRFFCELALYDRYFLTVPMSLIAIAANLLACSMLGVDAAASNLRTLLTQAPPHDSSAGSEENMAPSVQGAFLSGLDGTSLNQLRKIALVLILQTTSLSEVLQRKYEALGVIPVLHNYTNKHALLVKAVIEHSPAILADEPNALAASEVARVADVLLQIGQEDLKPPQMFSSSQASLPLTPPSASQSSVFSHHASSSAYSTPIMHSGQFGYSPMPTSDPAWSSPLVPKGH